MISVVLVKSLLTAFVRYRLDNAVSKPTRRTNCAMLRCFAGAKQRAG